MGDSSIQDLIRIFFDIKIKAFALEILLIITILLLTAFLWKRIKNLQSNTSLFYIGVVYVIISSFFLPAARLSYMNVYWLLPLSFIVIKADDIKWVLKPELTLLISGFILNTIFNIFPKGIILSDCLIMVFTIISLFTMTNLKVDYEVH